MKWFAPPAAIAFIVAVALLEGAARGGLMPATVFPAPSAIAARASAARERLFHRGFRLTK